MSTKSKGTVVLLLARPLYSYSLLLIPAAIMVKLPGKVMPFNPGSP